MFFELLLLTRGVPPQTHHLGRFTGIPEAKWYASCEAYARDDKDRTMEWVQVVDRQDVLAADADSQGTYVIRKVWQ